MKYFSTFFFFVLFLLCSSLCFLRVLKSETRLPNQPTLTSPKSSVQLDNIELLTDRRIFAVMTALHAAGFQDESAGQGQSIVRSQIQEWIGDLDKDLSYRLRSFYKTHRDSSNIFKKNPQSAYVSLSLLLGPPPDFNLELEDSELPADVWIVRNFPDLVREFWITANISELWEIMEPLYIVELESYRVLFKDVVTSTLGYFRIPSRVSLGKKIILTINLLEINDMVNARNLEEIYFLVVGPSKDISRNRHKLEHEYLHFLLDDLVQKFGTSLLQHRSLLKIAQKQSDLRKEYQNNFLLLTTESLIEAIQIRSGPKKNPEELNKRMVRLFRKGLILTPYFYRSLEKYEQQKKLSLPSYLVKVIDNIGENLIRNDAKSIRKLEEIYQSEKFEIQENDRKKRSEIKTHNEYVKQFNKASELLNKGEFLEARQLLEQLRKSHPNNGKILFYLAQTNFKLQDYHSAFEYYRLCSQLSGIEDWILAWSRIRMGKIFASSGKYIEAKKLFRKVQGMEGDLRGATDEAVYLLNKLP